ncbi:hypothetical protein GCM10009548_66470 [Streptomyces malaysiensis subsp. malaysiensis]
MPITYPTPGSENKPMDTSPRRGASADARTVGHPLMPVVRGLRADRPPPPDRPAPARPVGVHFGAGARRFRRDPLPPSPASAGARGPDGP